MIRRIPRLALIGAAALGVALLVAGTQSSGPASAAAGSSTAWTVPLSGVGPGHGIALGDGGLRLSADAHHPASQPGQPTQGTLDLPARELAAPANRVAAALDADTPAGSAVGVEVRGRRVDGRWTEWSPARPGAPAVLPEATRTVALRVVLTAAPDGAGPVLRQVRAVADRVNELRTVPTPRALTSRVFATREGLTGATTANGHVIAPSDHFVALPSRRGLAADGSGDYTVKVCAANGRCEWAPAWDVGPWNTTDDYWNPSTQRQSWQDLALGLPEAQAAYVSGYNGGRDQFGRRVANPAGIDLADGTFNDGLHLPDNGYVTVSYLWLSPGAFAQARTYGTPLGVRSTPGRSGANVGYVAEFALVGLECQVPGDTATGTQGTTNVWYRVGPSQYVAKAYLANPPPVPAC